ncbi:MAG: ATP-binding protein [Nitrospirae bacterium]|nr:ATP-binding protein [Nitrospirota bacterium]
MRNPFIMGMAEGDDFCDRGRERKELYNHLTNGRSVVMYSPRRYGKSSLSLNILMEVQKNGFMGSYIDLFPVSSERDFMERFSSGVFEMVGRDVSSPKRMMEKIKKVFRMFTPSLEMKPDGSTKISLGLDPTKYRTGDVMLDELMKGFGQYMKSEDKRGIVILDEFQEIAGLSEGKKIEGILRSHIQRMKNVSFLYIGSRRGILKDMFMEKTRPFYKLAIPYVLGKIPEDEFNAHIAGKFRTTKKECPPEIASLMYNTVKGYPGYIQKLAMFSWDATEKVCSVKAVEDGLNSLLNSESYEMERIFMSLSPSQKTVLKRLCLNPHTPVFSKAFLSRSNVSLGGIQKSVDEMVKKDVIEKVGGENYTIVDPVLELWIMRAEQSLDLRAMLENLQNTPGTIKDPGE